MRSPLKYKHLSIIEQNVSYYNEIAGQYDEILEQDEGNRTVREKVSSAFCKIVGTGLVLDFGGGTGKDLGWLVHNGYDVIFCEPSVKMRDKAIQLTQKNPKKNQIEFLENAASDFTTWQSSLPFPQKVNAVLLNFAVINSIPYLDLLLKNLSLVTGPGGHMIMLVLNCDLKKRWQSGRLATLLSFITSTTITTTIQFNEQKQKVYFYTIRKIRKAAHPYFHFQSWQSFKENGFELIHFTRK